MRGTVPAALVLGCLLACTGGGGPPAKPGIPVTVATVATATIPVELEAVGHVEPSSTVSVHALVGGELLSTGFDEGKDVRVGDVLFTIDPAPYQAALAKADADLAQERAVADQTNHQLERYKTLGAKEYVSQDDLDKLTATAASAAATVQADEAAVRSAKLDLSHCTIQAPIAGRTGELLVHAGNLVKANDTELVVINQLAPVFVSFSAPERYAPEILARRQQGDLSVTSTLTRDGNETRTGTLSFVDNTVDPTTGTLALKASFPNADGALWPGQSTAVVLTLSEQTDAIVVPSTAIQDGQNGTFVYVVGADDTVNPVDVTVDRAKGTQTVISKGLTVGQTVVVDGQLLLSKGAKVDKKPASEAK